MSDLVTLYGFITVIIAFLSFVILLCQLVEGLHYPWDYQTAGGCALSLLLCWAWPVVIPVLLLVFGMIWLRKGMS